MADFTLYTRKGCSQCDKAKELLQEFGYTYHELNVDVHKKYLLERFPEIKKLPVIMHADDTLLGSLTELEQFFKDEVELDNGNV